MGKLSSTKIVAAVLCSLIIIFAAAESVAGISEPGVLLYGQVRDDSGTLVTSGTLELTLTPEGSETPLLSRTVQITEITAGELSYSYRTLLSMETPIAGHPATAQTLQLSESDVTYHWNASVPELGIVASGTMALGYADCGTGKNITLDARPYEDNDNDGLPDEWESQYMLDTSSAEGDDGPEGDPDRDGLSNFEEYVLNSDPTVANVTVPNTSPSAPSINAPAQGVAVVSLYPELSVNNADDPDDDEITYTFEVYTDEALTVQTVQIAEVPQGSNITTMTLTEPLADNMNYYWRARAYDGTEYSPWTDVASFTINTQNDAPGIPVLVYPPDNTETAELQPSLMIHRALDADGDALTHELAVFSDDALTSMVAGPGIVAETGGTQISWVVDAALTDGATYYWSARAADGQGETGDWATAWAFTVNTSNAAPAAPEISAPEQGAQIAALPPTLMVVNGSDPDGDTLTYEFQIDLATTFDSPALETSAAVDQATGGETGWTPSADLMENTTYYWRVSAFDGQAYSPWVFGEFFVNTENSPPTAPGLLNPGDGSTVSDLFPTLSLIPAEDEDGDTMTYDYQVYLDDHLAEDDVVDYIQSAGTSWQVETQLANRTTYMWRARAVDAHGAAGPWTGTAAFLVNANTRPSAPVLNNPVSGGIVSSTTPALSVRNALDPEGDPLFYEFELYADAGLTNAVATGLVGEDDLSTQWTVSVLLADQSTYYWRARATDGILDGPWTPTAVFTVHTDGQDTVLTIETAVNVSADNAADQVAAVADENSPINGVSVTIPPGALEADCTVTIGWVENPPALPGSTLALGKVLEFGPHGTTFASPVTISIPYTQEDLTTAGISDPAELSVLTYDPIALSWNEIPVASVDTEYEFLIVSVDHFSIYAKGRILESDDSNGGSSGGSSGDCFINTTMESMDSKAAARMPLFILMGLVSAILISRRQWRNKDRNTIHYKG